MQSVKKMAVGKIVGLFVILLTVVLMFKFSVMKPSSSNTWQQLQSIQSLQWFSSKSDLEELAKSKVVLIHFWATWCKPCEEELPGLVEFFNQLDPNLGVKVLAVSLDDSIESANRFLSKNGHANWVNLLDPKHEFAKSIGSYQYPETVVVSGEGKILMKWVGPQSWDQNAWKEQFLLWLSKI